MAASHLIVEVLQIRPDWSMLLHRSSLRPFAGPHDLFWILISILERTGKATASIGISPLDRKHEEEATPSEAG